MILFNEDLKKKSTKKFTIQNMITIYYSMSKSQNRTYVPRETICYRIQKNCPQNNLASSVCVQTIPSGCPLGVAPNPFKRSTSLTGLRTTSWRWFRTLLKKTGYRFMTAGKINISSIPYHQQFASSTRFICCLFSCILIFTFLNILFERAA